VVDASSTLRACKTQDIKKLEQKLINRRTREVRKARDTGSDSAVAAIEDKYDCLNIFLQNADTVDELCDSIMDLFDEKRKGLLTLFTIHKAKGLEWQKIFRLDFEQLLPSKWAALEWQKKQEKHLQYVCTTRAKLDIVDITSNSWRKEGDVKCQSTSPHSDTASIVDNTTNSVNVPACNPPPTFEPDAVDTLEQQHNNTVDAEVYLEQNDN